MSAPDPRAEALAAHYERAGYARIAPAILQPAEPFLDLSGEDIRRRMFLTTDPDGRELCLRPDLTIPVSCEYLASPEAGWLSGQTFQVHGGSIEHIMTWNVDHATNRTRPVWNWRPFGW